MMNDFIKKKWVLLNILFVLLIIAYQLLKHFIFRGELIIEKSSPLSFNFYGFLFLIVGISSLVVMLYKSDNKILNILLLVLGYSALCIGYILQKDPELKWEGSDVAWTNYDLAKEVVEYGPLFIVDTWNNRANPYDSIGSDPLLAKAQTIAFIQKYKINWLYGDKWVVRDLPIDKSNNRPYMHPPLASIIMGQWFSIFPVSRLSLQTFMIIIMLFSFIIIFILFEKDSPNNYAFYLLFFTILTTPVSILFTNPSAEQLTMLLTGLSVIILYKKMNEGFFYPFISGILIGLAFYSKFIVAFYIFFQLASLVIFYKKYSLKPFVGYLTGLILVFGAFTALGYYFWLTILTGQAVANVYSQEYPISLLRSLVDFAYFGPSFLMILILLVFNCFNKYKDYKFFSISIPLLLGISIYLILTWKLGTFNRYILVFIMALFPFLFNSIKTIDFSQKDILATIISNFSILILIMYF